MIQATIKVLIFIACLLAGAFVNGGLIQLGYTLISPPPGYNLNSEEGFQAAVKQMQFRHFIFPFLAHALGTFASVWLWSSLNNQVRWQTVFLIAGFFFTGGALMVYTVNAPFWFELLDLMYAYFPWAILAYLTRWSKLKIIK